MDIALAADQSVYFRYSDGQGGQKVMQGLASLYWPELNSFVASLQKDTATVGDVVTTKLIRGYKGPVDLTQKLTETFEMTRQCAGTPKYSKRLKDGEVFMNPYSVGTVTVSRTVGCQSLPVNPTTGSVASQVGWLSGWDKITAFFNRYGAQPPAPPPTWEGLPLREVKVLLTWRWVQVADSLLYLSPPYTPPTSVPGLAIDADLVTSVVADASDGEYDLLTELGELPETMGFLGECVKSALCLTADLEDEARAARKRIPGAKYVEWLSNHWLKGRYALLPIFYSIQDIQKVLASIDREYGRYQSQASVSCILGEVSVAGCIIKISDDATARCVMKVRYTITSLIEQLTRLMNVNLFTSIWEWTTLSFVADWAFNIGNYIQAATGSTGATDMCTSFTVKDTSTLTITYDNDMMPAATTVKLKLYRRDIINPYDHIGLEFTLGRNLNWKRCIDAFALSARPGIRRFESVFKKQGAI